MTVTMVLVEGFHPSQDNRAKLNEYLHKYFNLELTN